jgi:hypothetical protein
VIIFVRRGLPENPRWLITHGRADEAEETISAIERDVERSGRALAPVDPAGAIELRPIPHIGYAALLGVLFRRYPTRSVLGAGLMITRSFLYNAIFFTYTLVLTRFYGVDPTSAPLFLIAFAVGNLAGPLLLGRFFDTVGRKTMIASTYVLAGALLAITAVLFDARLLTARTQTVAWCVSFFFASAGASAAYLTVSEIFPLEVRAKAIAVFFAIAQCFGALSPVVYGSLMGDGSDRTACSGATCSGRRSWPWAAWWRPGSASRRRADRWRTSPHRCPPVRRCRRHRSRPTRAAAGTGRVGCEQEGWDVVNRSRGRRSACRGRHPAVVRPMPRPARPGDALHPHRRGGPAAGHVHRVDHR